MEGVLMLKSASHPNCSSQNLLSSSPLLSVVCVTSAPPPPPPPPPPPHLLPPTPLLFPPPFGSRDGQRRSMKKLNWDTIPSQRVLGRLNVWTSKRSQRDLVLDIRSMEELFSHVDKRASLRNSRAMGPFLQEPQVTILDSKKSMNIGIFLRNFKRPVAEMIQDIGEGNWLRFGAGKLKELCKLLPEDGEVKQLLSFSGKLSALPVADQFMVQLIKVPYYEERLKTMVLREEFSPLMEEVKNSVAVMSKAANELLDCDDLHSVIRLVLKAGNYMNAGGYSENAIGFRMTSLLKLADTKANKPGMNLMHYVAKQAEDSDSELLTFPSQLEHIGVASRICKEDIIKDFEKQAEKIKEVKLYSNRQLGFFQQMGTFLMRAEAKLLDVESHLREFKALSNAVAEYFCEDPSTFKLEECCSIFHSFCKRFDTAVRENREREGAEQRCRRKVGMRIATTCHSTVSWQRAEPDVDSSSLEAVLHGFLSAVPEGLARYRKNTLPPLEGSSAERSSQTDPLLEETEAVPCTRQERPDKEPPKLQREDQPLVQEGQAERLHEITQKVPQEQNGTLDGDKVPGAPRNLEGAQDSPATPSTPRPQFRDYFFAHNGDVGSPWTILSTSACPQRKPILLNRQAHQLRLSSALTNGDCDDGVWESDKGSHREGLTCPSTGGSESLPERPGQRAASGGPILRSVSMDESRQSPACHPRLGDLFQKSVSQRSYSSGSMTENAREKEALMGSVLGSKAENRAGEQASASMFISFFRRIGGRGQPGGVEEESRGFKT